MIRYWSDILIKKRVITVFSIFSLVLITGFAIVYNYIDSRLTGNSVGIVRAEEGMLNRPIAPLPEGIQIITEEEFIMFMEGEAIDLTDEEMREAIDRDFNQGALSPGFIEEGFITGNVIDEIAALMYMDSIYEREEISDRIINILFLGDDARIHQSRGRSDTMILISYNRDTRVLSLTSFMRDILVPISLTSSYWNRINTMHAVGGPGRAINLINNIFSLDIQRYAVVRFTGVFMLVDALGGLYLYLRAEEAVVVNRIFPDFDPVSAGYNLLNGRQVLAYSRMRVIDHDLARTQRQRNVLRALLDKVLDTQNISDIFTIATFALDHVETNILLDEVVSIGLDLFTGPRPIVEELRIPIDGSFNHARFNGANILTIDFEKNITALHESIYNSADGVWIPDFPLPNLDRPAIVPTEGNTNAAG